MWRGAVRFKWDAKAGVLHLKLPSYAAYIVPKIAQTNPEYMQVEIRKIGKPRTTGVGSQNHAINGYCQQIAVSTGQDFDTVKAAMKHEALGAGYPYDTETLTGKPQPWSESRINTDQAAILIDTIKRIAAEFNIVLEG